MLGVAIITYNEEKNLARTLEAISTIASKIVIIDSFSQDGTQKIAKEYGAEFIQRKWSGFAEQKQFAIENLNTPWILALDADEVLSAECASEINKIINSTTVYAGYQIPRYLHFMGKTLKFGKGVDSPLRLFRQGLGKYDRRLIHEKIEVSGPVNILESGMIHYSAETISKRLSKIKRDNQLEIEHYNVGQGSLARLLLNPPKNFYFNFFKRRGYRDGLPGFINTLLFAYQILDHEYRFLKKRVK